MLSRITIDKRVCVFVMFVCEGRLLFFYKKKSVVGFQSAELRRYNTISGRLLQLFREFVFFLKVNKIRMFVL